LTARLFERLHTVDDCRPLVRDAWGMMEELYPICRSITGEGARSTLRAIGDRIPLEITNVPSGTPVFDWEVPREWNMREAWIEDPSGRRVVDVRNHSLHIVSYSTPVRGTFSLAELRPHLHTLPDHPDWIPYRTSYYRDAWGFCLTHRTLESMTEGDYSVCIDTSLTAGHLTYAECVVRGRSSEEVLVFTHICHPSLCNDNLTGIALATLLAAELQESRPRFTYSFSRRGPSDRLHGSLAMNRKYGASVTVSSSAYSATAAR